MARFAKIDKPPKGYMSGFCQEYRFLVKPFLILFAIMVLAMSAIIRADYNYIDDVLRVAYGGRGFTFYGRYVSELMSMFVHADTFLADASPLPQLLACGIVAAAGAIVLNAITGRTQFTFWEMAAVLPLGLSPYFLQCLSYKYDSPYMALSVLASVLPVLFWKKGDLIYGAIAFLSTLVMCMTYQAASGIFPVLVILLAVKMWNEKEKLHNILKFIGISASAYLVALVVFRFFIYTEQEGYAAASIPAIAELIPTALKNLTQFYCLVAFDFKLSWLILSLLVCISFVVVFVVTSKRNKLGAFGMAMLALVLMLSLCFGAFVFIGNTIYEPRAMYGFGALLAILGVYAASTNAVPGTKLISFTMAWCFVVFAFIYGNALEEQKVYTDFRVTSFVEDIKEWDEFTEDKTMRLRITGSAGFAPTNDTIFPHNKVLLRLIPPTFVDTSLSMFSGLDLMFFYGLDNLQIDLAYDVEKEALTLIEDNVYHTIWGNSEYIWVELKNTNKNVSVYLDAMLSGS